VEAQTKGVPEKLLQEGVVNPRDANAVKDPTSYKDLGRKKVGPEDRTEERARKKAERSGDGWIISETSLEGRER
jgi:hypothetical protein